MRPLVFRLDVRVGRITIIRYSRFSGGGGDERKRIRRRGNGPRALGALISPLSWRRADNRVNAWEIIIKLARGVLGGWPKRGRPRPDAREVETAAPGPRTAVTVNGGGLNVRDLPGGANKQQGWAYRGITSTKVTFVTRNYGNKSSCNLMKVTSYEWKLHFGLSIQCRFTREKKNYKLV